VAAARGGAAVAGTVPTRVSKTAATRESRTFSAEVIQPF
jgi:hypothetical protein